MAVLIGERRQVQSFQVMKRLQTHVQKAILLSVQIFNTKLHYELITKNLWFENLTSLILSQVRKYIRIILLPILLAETQL